VHGASGGTTAVVVDTFLGRALTDPTTGLPNIPYFCMIQRWEERRARRRQTQVRILRLSIQDGGDDVRRALTWRLCQELRTSDLIASEGRSELRVLLTSPDAEHIEAVVERIERLTGAINAEPHAGAGLDLRVHVEEPAMTLEELGPCDPGDDPLLR
jgi:GGDEF domain-containing protein